jgi:hypothetical protein
MADNAYNIPPPIILSPTPFEIDCADIEINADTCVANAYLIAQKYPSVEIAEGLILIHDTNNVLLAVPHVWNKIGNLYFDVTNERSWDERKKINKVESITYFFIKLHTFEAMQEKGSFEFCFETTENIAGIKDFLFNQGLSKN